MENWKCPYIKKDLIDHHIFPKSLGGKEIGGVCPLVHYFVHILNRKPPLSSSYLIRMAYCRKKKEGKSWGKMQELTASVCKTLNIPREEVTGDMKLLCLIYGDRIKKFYSENGKKEIKKELELLKED